MTFALFVIPALLSIATVPIHDNGNVLPTLGIASAVLCDREICQQDVLRYEAHENWAQEKIEVELSREISSSLSTVRIGVCDTGIDVDHIAFDSSIVSSAMHRDFTISSGQCIGNSTTDVNGRGTHVAGVRGEGYS